MPKLTISSESVQKNINRYWITAKKHPNLIKDAARVKQWKVYRTDKGEWRFGPSRFVGYEEMTAEEYVKLKQRSNGGLSGTETEAHLRKWTENVTHGSRLHYQLLDALNEFLADAGLKVGKVASFSLLSVDGAAVDLDAIDPVHDDAEVDALVTLSKRLSGAQLQKLTRRLGALRD